MANMEIEIRALGTKWAAVDKTLTASGAPADAKTVGDRLADTVTQGELTAMANTLRAEMEGQKFDQTTLPGTIATEFDRLFTSKASTLYPVGSIVIYDSTVEQNPADVLGFGTWERIEGRFLFGSDEDHAAGTTGGAATVSHSHGGTSGETALTTDQIPAHTHGNKELKGSFYFTTFVATRVKAVANNFIAVSGGVVQRGNQPSQKYSAPSSVSAEASAHTGNNAVIIDASHEHSEVGGGQGHAHQIPAEDITVMPPYEAVNIWRRVA